MILRDFLLKNDRKKIHLLLLLYYRDLGDGVPFDTIEKALHLSHRSLKTLIQEMEDDAELSSQLSWSWFSDRLRLEMTPDTNLRAVIQLFFRRLTITKLLLTVLVDESLSVSAMAQKLHVSNSTVYRLVTQFNRAMLKHNSIHIDIGHLRVVGDERQVRSFYNELICEVMAPHAVLFPTLPHKAFSEFIALVLKTLTAHLDLYRSQRFYRFVAINLERYRHGHLLNDIGDIHPRVAEFIDEASQPQSPFQSFARRFDTAIDKTFFYNLFAQYSKKDIFLSLDNIMDVSLDPTDHGERTKTSMIVLGQSLFVLADRYEMPIDDIRLLILELHNRMVLETEYGAMSFLFWDPHAALIEGMRRHYPAFFAALEESLSAYYARFFGPPQPSIISQLTVVSIAHWGRFMDKLIDHYGRLTLLVLNSFNSGLGRENVALLENLFGRIMRIEFYDGPYREDLLTRPDSPHYDLVLSNFEIAVPPKTDVIYFDSAISPLTVQSIYRAMSAHFGYGNFGEIE